jgi:diguanylate cyclase (GGDEF)-like protein/PAS domain S-box-containing protein
MMSVMTCGRYERMSWPGVWVCALIALAAQVFFSVDAHALRAIEINPEVERLELSALGDPYEGKGDTLQIETAPGSDGLTGRMSVRAATRGTTPNWFVFALRNASDKPLERWVVADRYNIVGSGIVWPDLDSRRIDNVTPSIGFVPERISTDKADVFRLTIEPGQTVTYIVEIATDRLPRLTLWRGTDFERRARDRQLFNGTMLGITGLLAIFLTAVFAANHKAIFPSAALFTWCVLAYLCVDFGFWHKLFNVKPEENAQYRAAGEAAMAATLLIFTHIFLRIGYWHAFLRLLFGLWIAAQLALIGLAFLDPKLATTFARLSSGAIGGICVLLILVLALRGQDRALSLVPTWILYLVWLFGASLTLTGQLSGEFMVPALTSGLVLVVVLIGFTVTQYAFRAAEPIFGSTLDEQQVRSLAIESTGVAVWEWGARRDEVKCSRSMELSLGLEQGSLTTKLADFLDRMYQSDRERFQQILASIRERGSGEIRTEFRMRHADNVFRWFELEASAVPSDDRRAVRCVGLVREITDAKRAQERLMHDAVHDNLTGLPNRALFLDRLAVAITRAQSEPLVTPTVLYVDLDRFKSVNSSFGLVVGDSLLLTVARRLAKHLGPNDTLGRIAGDRFAVLLLSNDDPKELARLADAMRRSLRSPVSISDQEIVMTAAIGISIFDRTVAPNAADFLGEAEAAMHRAKGAGPDQIEIFKPEMRSDKDQRLSMESDLRQALEKKQLRLFYQPIVYLRTEEIAGFEALVRWEHPRLGLLNPVDFVPLAEESDLIVKLGSTVLQMAVAEAQRWHKELPRPEAPLYVSVNVSSRQLFRQDLINEVRHIIGRAVLPKGTLRLELTETLVMENPEQASEMLTQLVSAGAGLSLDDFGAGYSSLSYLNTFPFDTIKIDRALVHAPSKNGSSSAVLRSIVALAHELGKRVVAEGVETDEDVGLLRSIGCENAQGFYYGEPMPPKEVLQLLKQVRKEERRLKRGGLFRLKSRRIDDEAAAPSVVAAEPSKPNSIKQTRPDNGDGPPDARSKFRRGPVPKSPKVSTAPVVAERQTAAPGQMQAARDVQSPPMITVPPPVAPVATPVSAPAAWPAAAIPSQAETVPLFAVANEVGRPEPFVPPMPGAPNGTFVLNGRHVEQPFTMTAAVPALDHAREAPPPPELSAGLAQLEAMMAVANGVPKPPGPPAFDPPLDAAARVNGAHSMPQGEPVPPPAYVRPRVAMAPAAKVEMPDLSTLPPAIAASLAKLAGGQPVARKTQAPPRADAHVEPDD